MEFVNGKDDIPFFEMENNIHINAYSKPPTRKSKHINPKILILTLKPWKTKSDLGRQSYHYPPWLTTHIVSLVVWPHTPSKTWSSRGSRHLTRPNNIPTHPSSIQLRLHPFEIRQDGFQDPIASAKAKYIWLQKWGETLKKQCICGWNWMNLMIHIWSPIFPNRSLKTHHGGVTPWPIGSFRRLRRFSPSGHKPKHHLSQVEIKESRS